MRFYMYLLVILVLLTLQVQTQDDDEKGTILKVSVKMFETNKPAQYARVHVRKVFNVHVGEKPLDFVHISNDEGIAHFKGLIPGEYILHVDGFWPEGGSFIPIKADTYAIKSDSFIEPGTINGKADGGEITVKGDKKVVHHTITLYTSAKLKVTVTYDDGTPVKGASIHPLDTRYGLKAFSKVGEDKKTLTVGNLTDEKGECTIYGFNAELEPNVAIDVSFGEERLPDYAEDDPYAYYKVVRYKAISNIKISTYQENSILIKFRRLDRSNVVAKGRLKLARLLTGQEYKLASLKIYIQDGEIIGVPAGEPHVQDREVICVPDDDGGFSYTLFDITPGKYKIDASITLAITDEDRFPLWLAWYEKTTEIQIEKDKVTTLDITLTEDDKTTEHHFGH